MRKVCIFIDINANYMATDLVLTGLIIFLWYSKSLIWNGELKEL